MEPVTAFALSLALVGLLALVVVLALRRPLTALLVELCGNDPRAHFWTVFAGLGIVLAAFECALLTMPGSSSGVWGDQVGLRVLLSGLRAGVFGLLAGYVVLGLVLSVAILRYEHTRRAGRLASPGPR